MTFFGLSEVALKIAREDSIKHPDNLLAEISKPKNGDQFYWVISGQNRYDVDYSNKPKEGWNILPKRKENTR